MFAERLKGLRKAKGLSQVKFARELSVANGTVGMWETGNREPSIEMIAKIANYFGVTSDYLIGLSDVPYYPHSSIQDSQEVTIYTTKKEAPLQKELEDFNNAPRFKGEISSDVKEYIDYLFDMHVASREGRKSKD